MTPGCSAFYFGENMNEKIKGLGEALQVFPEHLLHIAIVLVGAVIGITHGPHSFDVGSGLVTAGLAMYKGKQ